MMDRQSPPWPDEAALFLDFDGTLLELAEDPWRVAPSPRLRALLPELAPSCGGAVALVSGRPIAEIDRLLDPHRFPAAGIHGLERRDASGTFLSAPTHNEALAGVRRLLVPFVERHSGLLLEDKEQTLALHYRRRPDLEADVREIVGALRRGLPAELEILPGRKVFEIKPSATSKGHAIQAFMTEPPFRDRTPVFLGDDVTDEAGFVAVNALGGVSIKVSDGETVAKWRLPNVPAVLDWLERCVSA